MSAKSRSFDALSFPPLSQWSPSITVLPDSVMEGKLNSPLQIQNQNIQSTLHLTSTSIQVASSLTVDSCLDVSNTYVNMHLT